MVFVVLRRIVLLLPFLALSSWSLLSFVVVDNCNDEPDMKTEEPSNICYPAPPLEKEVYDSENPNFLSSSPCLSRRLELIISSALIS